MAVRAYIAKQLYEANCAAYGGKDSDGNPLPSWQSLVSDPKKRAVCEMWGVAADRSMVSAQEPRRSVAGGWE